MNYRLPHPDADTPKAGLRPDGDRRERLGRGVRRRRAVRRRLAVLPTLLTLGNLLCGFVAVFLASRSADTPMPLGWTPLTFAATAVFVGMIFDALDGRVARLTRQTSRLGEQLDSMADMVSFGVAPAFIAIQLVRIDAPFISERPDFYFDRVTLLVGCIYVACCALRLARFNVEVAGPAVHDHLSFKGLPSPGAAGTVAGMVLLHQHLLAGANPQQWYMTAASAAMVGVMLLSALAMTSRLPYVHAMNRFVRGRARSTTIGRVVVVALLMLVFPQWSLAGLFVLYALSGPVAWAWQRLPGRPPSTADGPASSAVPVVLGSSSLADREPASSISPPSDPPARKSTA